MVIFGICDKMSAEAILDAMVTLREISCASQNTMTQLRHVQERLDSLQENVERMLSYTYTTDIPVHSTFDPYIDFPKEWFEV